MRRVAGSSSEACAANAAVHGRRILCILGFQRALGGSHLVCKEVQGVLGRPKRAVPVAVAYTITAECSRGTSGLILLQKFWLWKLVAAMVVS